MEGRTRRSVLQTSSVPLFVGLSGCFSLQSQTGSPSQGQPSETNQENEAITNWERSTACDSMHDSVIKVEHVTTSIGEDYVPIQYSDLPAGEKAILQTVTTQGGYGTCETSQAFERFINRVMDHLDSQDTNALRVYLERDGRFYQLYVEDLDQVFAH